MFCAPGVTDVNYDLYPSQELQRDWLTAYLESYKHGSGREVTVTEAEVTQLYHHVCKFSLVSVLRVIKQRGNTGVISSFCALLWERLEYLKIMRLVCVSTISICVQTSEMTGRQHLPVTF